MPLFAVDQEVLVSEAHGVWLNEAMRLPNPVGLALPRVLEREDFRLLETEIPSTSFDDNPGWEFRSLYLCSMWQLLVFPSVSGLVFVICFVSAGFAKRRAS